MPLSDENRKLVEQRRLAEPTWSNWDQHPAALDRLLNACRLEERAKAEGEVEAKPCQHCGLITPIVINPDEVRPELRAEGKPTP